MLLMVLVKHDFQRAFKELIAPKNELEEENGLAEQKDTILQCLYRRFILLG